MLTRNSDRAYSNSVRLSICPFVMFRYCIETVLHIIILFSNYFGFPSTFRNSDWVPQRECRIQVGYAYAIFCEIGEIYSYSSLHRSTGTGRHTRTCVCEFMTLTDLLLD